MKKSNIWNIKRLVDESFGPSTQQPSILKIEDCRIFRPLRLIQMLDDHQILEDKIVQILMFPLAKKIGRVKSQDKLKIYLTS